MELPPDEPSNKAALSDITNAIARGEGSPSLPAPQPVPAGTAAQIDDMVMRLDDRVSSELRNMYITTDLAPEIKRMEALFRIVQDDTKTFTTREKAKLFMDAMDLIHRMKNSKFRMEKHQREYISFDRLEQLMNQLTQVLESHISDEVVLQKIHDDFHALTGQLLAT